MDIANYKTAVNRAGQVGHYPLSTETLDFIQEQIKLLQKLSSITGYQHPWIIRSPNSSSEGVLLYNDELLPIEPISIPLTKGTTYDLCLRERKQEVQTLEDTYRDARLYRTAYIAAKGTAQAIGSVEATSTTSVHTPGAFTLAQLAKVATSVERIELTEELIESRSLQHNWLGKKLLYVSSPVEPSGVLMLADLDNSYLTTTLIEGSGDSFIQELETEYGVKYRRMCLNHTDYTERREHLNPGGITGPWTWKCIPGQVLGSCTIIIGVGNNMYANPDPGKGILRGVKILSVSDDGVIISPKKPRWLASLYSRLVISSRYSSEKELQTAGVVATYVQQNGSISISFEKSKMPPTMHLVLSMISV